MDRETNKERSYIAFISYRHTPLDREAAERVQKKIESYRVPKEFREKVGSDRLGMCFRDEDELPASASLSDSIYYALDHTKFLIVICTPDLPLSKWCEAEIRYFLKTHDRDHLLAVLADGDPSEAFSPYMLHDYDEEGNITKDWEPLAANIAGPNHTIDNKAFKKEIVRLYAALIGCPFDELWQRDRRARTRRLGIAGAAAFAVMAVFLGVVLNRNAQIEARNVQISEQNDQITEQYDRIVDQNEQIKEQNDEIQNKNTELQKQMSTVLVDAGFDKLESHDINGALKDGLAALESDDPDIYDHRAEKLLADALGAYRSGVRFSTVVYAQPSKISDYVLTDDEKHVILVDTTGLVRCLDTEKYELCWEMKSSDSKAVLYTKNLDDKIIIKTRTGAYCLSADTGVRIWSFEHSSYSENRFSCLSEDGKILVLFDQMYDGSVYRPSIIFLDAETGSELGRTSLYSENFSFALSSSDGTSRYGAAFSERMTKFACALPGKYKDDEGNDVYATFSFVVHMDTFEKENVIRTNNVDMVFGVVCYDDNDDVFIAEYISRSGGIYTALCTKTDGTYSIDDEIVSHDLASSDGGMYYDYDSSGLNRCHMLVSNDRDLIIFSDNRLLFFDRFSNTLRNAYAIKGEILDAFWLNEEKTVFEIQTSDGWMICYELGTGSTIIKSLYGYNGDENDLVRSLPLGGGMIKWTGSEWTNNFEYGTYLTLSASAPGSLMLLSAKADENGEIFDLPYDEFGSFGLINSIPDSDLILCAYSSKGYNDPARYFFMYSRDKKSVSASVSFDGLSVYNDVLAVDENSFIQGNKRYFMDGSSEEYAAPAALNDYSEATPSVNIRLNNGSILSYASPFFAPINDYYDGGYLSVIAYPVWIDGKLIESTLSPEKALLAYYNYDTNDDPKVCAGECGYLCVYGRRVFVSNEKAAIDDAPSFLFMNALTGEITKAPAPDTEHDWTMAMGHKSPVGAVAYENGDIWLISAEGSSRKLETGFDTNEINAICFSDDDRYLAVLSTSDTLYVFNTESEELEFSENLTFFDDDTNYSSVYLYAQTIASDGRLIITAKSLSSPGARGNAVIIEPESWVITEKLKNVITYDPLSDRIYLLYDSKKPCAFPVYTLEMLKSRAESLLSG